jgi:hypothetical protein
MVLATIFVSLFRDNQDGKINISSLTNQVFDLTSTNRPIVVIDLSSREKGILEWDDNIEKLVIKRLLQKFIMIPRDIIKMGDH